MKRRWIYLIIICIIIISCKKEKHPPVFSSGGDYSSVQFKCDTLPPEPGMGWIDTLTEDGARDIIYYAYNPVNSKEIIYMNLGGNLYSYNIKYKTRKFLDSQIMSVPKINQKGWVTYGKLNFCTYIIKTNGDSLKQLNSSFSGQIPSWDFTGNYIYYLQNGICVKSDKNGNKVDSINFNCTGAAFAHNSDSYIDLSNNTLRLVNRSTSQITDLTTVPSDHGHLCFDKNDENLFWCYQYGGLMKLNIATKKIDTLVKFCENFLVARLNVSPNSDKLTMGHLQLSVPGSKWKRYSEYHPIEYDVKNGTWSKLNILFN